MLSPLRSLELLTALPWRDGEKVRAVWIQVDEMSRTGFAKELIKPESPLPVIPLIVREPSFITANALLSDINKLLIGNRDQIERLTVLPDARLTLAILAKEEFRLPQVSSPVVLPEWFPLWGGREIDLRVSDLLAQAEVDLLNCEEMRSEQIASLLVELEKELVQAFRACVAGGSAAYSRLFTEIYSSPKDPAPDVDAAIAGYQQHIDEIQDPRGYRPTLRPNTSLLSRLIKVVLRSSPDQLGAFSKVLAGSLGLRGPTLVKPPLIAILLRPTLKLEPQERNAHGMLLALYAAYQSLTGVAHAGEYPMYPVRLLLAISVDIRTALRDYSRYLSDGQ